jgi:hypothetical protein
MNSTDYPADQPSPNTLVSEEPIIDADESAETTPFRYSITAYGADYPVDGLVKRLHASDIIIPTFDPEVKPGENLQGFQRQYVWTKPQCDRFIESLLLGLPVPGIFLVKQADGRLLVLDGQQRLRTLRAFYEGLLRGKEFTLANVQMQYKEKTYKTLDVEDRRRIDDSIIHATIVRQDEPSNDLSSIYLMFERLNTGGTSLQPQEIRVALYHGNLISFLRELNENADWRKLCGAKSARFKDQELILRFFALLYWADQYARPMKDFLNRYTAANRNFQLIAKQELVSVFERTTAVVVAALGTSAFRLKNAVNAAVLDSVMVGLADRLLRKGQVNNLGALRTAYQILLASGSYLNAVGRATADEEYVRTRLRLAKEAFAVID